MSCSRPLQIRLFFFRFLQTRFDYDSSSTSVEEGLSPYRRPRILRIGRQTNPSSSSRSTVERVPSRSSSRSIFPRCSRKSRKVSREDCGPRTGLRIRSESFLSSRNGLPLALMLASLLFHSSQSLSVNPRSLPPPPLLSQAPLTSNFRSRVQLVVPLPLSLAYRPLLPLRFTSSTGLSSNGLSNRRQDHLDLFARIKNTNEIETRIFSNVSKSSRTRDRTSIRR